MKTKTMTKAKTGKGKIGSSLESLFQEEGTYDAAQAVAIKRVLAFQVEQAMQKQSLTKTAMAKRMHTSRSQLDRLLDPENHAVSYDIMARAAQAVGRTLKIELR